MPRGTLQTVFVYTPFDEVRRLGLRNETETEVRRKFPNRPACWSCPKCSAARRRSTCSSPATSWCGSTASSTADFDTLAEVLDDGVGKTVKLYDRARRPGARARARRSQDLYAVTPDRYLEFGDARRAQPVVAAGAAHQRADQRRVCRQSGLRARRGGVPRGAVITEVDGKRRSPTLADFERVVGELKDGERVTVRFFTIDDPQHGAVCA